MQNIPIRTLRESTNSGVFVSGEKIISADYSQIELRLIARNFYEKNMIKTAQKWGRYSSLLPKNFSEFPLEEVSKTQRSQAKP